LDIIRTHHQVGTPGSVFKLFREEGLPAMYSGLGSVLISLAASNFVYFYTNILLKLFVKKITKEQTISVGKNLLIASFAGVVNVYITSPLWVANTRIKLQKSNKKPTKESETTQKENIANKPYTGLIDCMYRIYNEEGFTALWNGSGSSLMLVSNPTINFVVYDKVKALVDSRVKASGRNYLNSFEIFTIGAIAKAMATIFTYPIQVAQSRQRANRQNNSGGAFSNTFKILREIFAKDGFLGWFAGMNAKLTQTVVMAAFQFLCYEQIQNIIFDFMGKPK